MTTFKYDSRVSAAIVVTLSMIIATAGGCRKKAVVGDQAQVLLARASVTAQLLANAASAARLKDNRIDRYLLETIALSAMRADAGITYVMIRSSDGEIMFSIYAGQREGQKNVPEEIKINSYDLEKPITAPGNRPMGYVNMGYARKAIEEQIKLLSEGK